jgi:hypothetical protein
MISEALVASLVLAMGALASQKKSASKGKAGGAADEKRPLAT